VGPAGKKTIWITRAEPGAAATAERVRALGHEALVAPLLRVRDIEDVRVDLEGVSAIAFTSANGVRAFSARTTLRDRRVFAVGAATAAAARAVGFKTVLSADGDVDALAERIAQRKIELKGSVLHAGAAEPAGDLVGALTRHGVEARLLALYETDVVEITAEDARRLTAAHIVLLHSPKAAKALLKVLKAAPSPNLRVLALSKAVLKPLARAAVATKAHPPFPLEAALLNLIDRSS
jgi:uroporphyrinogen-III synthase